MIEKSRKFINFINNKSFKGKMYQFVIRKLAKMQ